MQHYEQSSDDTDKQSVFSLGSIIACALIIFGTYLLITTIIRLIGFDKDRPVYKQAQTTIGSIKTVTVKRKSVCQVSYTFEVEDATYTSPTIDDREDTHYYNSDNCRKVRGQIATVNYNPNNPAINSLAADSAPQATDLISDIGPIPVGIALILVGAYALSAMRKIRQQNQPDISMMAEANYLEEMQHGPRR